MDKQKPLYQMNGYAPEQRDQNRRVGERNHTLSSPCGSNGGCTSAFTYSAGTLAIAAPIVGPETTGGDILELFRHNPNAVLLPVIGADEVILGTIEQHLLLSQMARPLWRDVYERRSILSLMNARPLIVDEATPIDAVKRMIVSDYPDAIQTGFVVTRHGRFLGTGTIEGLLALTNEQAHERLKQLDQACRAAEAAARAKSSFLATMSHELRTPLNAIIGFSEFLLHQSGQGVAPARLVEYLGDIHSSGRHLLQIINDILDYSKLEADAVQLQVEFFDLHGLLTKTAAIARGQGAARDIAVLLDCPTLLVAYGDELRLRQAVLNLLSNAVKFSPSAATVVLRGRADDLGRTIIEVKDDGPGIAESDIERIFEPFVQTDRDLNRCAGGTGLGLSLAREFVRLHGGSVLLQSELGKGTLATILLPGPTRAAA